MTRLLITGDWHYRGSNPIGRTDDYQRAVTSKLEEVFRLAHEQTCDAIIAPGDIFDSPNVSLSVVGDLADILAGRSCPVLAIPGNHDIYGGNPETAYRTPYGLLARLGLLWDLISEPWVSDDGSVVVAGRPFSEATDRDLLYTYGWSGEQEPWKLTVLVTHGMLLEEDPGFEIRHTTFDQLFTLKGQLPDVLVVGHYHLGWGIQESPTCINPGALTRLTAHPAEIERLPQVCLLAVENGSHHAELIALQSAAPGHKVLSRQHLEEAAKRQADTKRFLELLASEGEAKYLEIREITEAIARRENLEQQVVDEALRRLSQAREQLAAVEGW